MSAVSEVDILRELRRLSGMPQAEPVIGSEKLFRDEALLGGMTAENRIIFLGREILSLNQALEILKMDRDMLARANRDLQTQLNAVKECFETVISKLAEARGSY